MWVFAIILFCTLGGAKSSIIELEERLLRSKIDPQLHDIVFERQLRPENIFVSMSAGDVTSILANLDSQFTENTTKTERSNAIYNALNGNAQRTQASTLDFINNFQGLTGIKAESFWISNQIFIENANGILIRGLASLPEVAKVDKEGRIQMAPAIDVQYNETMQESRQGKIQWGVQKIKAPEAWQTGAKGKGIIVCVIDTGIRASHNILRDGYVGKDNFGWFDTVNGRAEPYDDQGHGTHCAGSVLGRNGYGVAPEAKLMGCKFLDSRGSGGEANAKRCGEFIICPTSADGRRKDCSKAPHIASNSWGSEGGHNSKAYDSMIDAWHKAKIIPIFAAGNSGDGNRCNTIGHPSEMPNVLAVGATDSSDALGSFSSKGPGPRNIQKPEISAPGVNIISAGHRSDSEEKPNSGTSIKYASQLSTLYKNLIKGMACPHVAGLAALMVGKKKDIGFERIKKILQDTAVRQLKSSNQQCGGKRDNQFPNFHFGWGRVDALAAVKAV